jgi:hypothetical protein
MSKLNIASPSERVINLLEWLSSTNYIKNSTDVLEELLWAISVI